MLPHEARGFQVLAVGRGELLFVHGRDKKRVKQTRMVFRSDAKNGYFFPDRDFDNKMQTLGGGVITQIEKLIGRPDARAGEEIVKLRARVEKQDDTIKSLLSRMAAMEKEFASKEQAIQDVERARRQK